MNLGKIEKNIYKYRQHNPVVIPQLDPVSLSKLPKGHTEKLLDTINKLELKTVVVGGSILDQESLGNLMDKINTHDLDCIFYPTYPYIFDPVYSNCAVYWMSVLNAENQYYLRDMLIMNSISANKAKLEIIPSTYVFDDRGSFKSAYWFTRANSVPRDKPEISLSLALSGQYSGSRIYIMAGGSGCKLIPPKEHISLLKSKTNLFLIPTSGIRTASDVKEVFDAGADAIHVGNALEKSNGSETLIEMVEVAKKFSGRLFEY